jgi:hypothetical protein
VGQLSTFEHQSCKMCKLTVVKGDCGHLVPLSLVYVDSQATIQRKKLDIERVACTWARVDKLLKRRLDMPRHLHRSQSSKEGGGGPSGEYLGKEPILQA